MAERSFYGGATPTGGQGGEISAGRYSGPEARASHPWKCPACAVENSGRLELGCVHCGAGKPGYHVGVQPPSVDEFTSAFDSVPLVYKAESKRSVISDAARAWVASNVSATVEEGFVAGYRLALAQQLAHTMSGPPVTADVADIAPAGKPARTIIAALELFKDQVLRGEPEEVTSGEWCSITEVEQLIEALKERAD